MRLVGFSTGALALSDFHTGLQMVRGAGLRAVELSALREAELTPLVTALDELDLSGFDYISLHAPSKLAPGREPEVVDLLRSVAESRGWSIIVHPDVITDDELWRSLSHSLCIENNDRRKSTGKTWKDLITWFDRFPEAGFCLDLGHARQVDMSMTEAYFMLKVLGDRLTQLHVSEVTTRSRHEPMSALCVRAFRQIAALVPQQVPVIIESQVTQADIAREVAAVRTALTPDAPAVKAATAASILP